MTPVSQDALPQGPSCAPLSSCVLLEWGDAREHVLDALPRTSLCLLRRRAPMFHMDELLKSCRTQCAKHGPQSEFLFKTVRVVIAML